ncbi:secreted aspartic proteinase precursor [Purpureocillium lavendulum]|uniref:Secreted aspartic proteinase n=1 Tax=Purpureocillium lavendulum TaxID=1247861 RepID=A0AB34G0Z4_9HYPO|nr:secreted aspartic proteinase precursor [Purpureocillium lavendulum]
MPTASTWLSKQPKFWNKDYLIEAKVGSPPQTLSLALDTASSDFWVFSNDTPADRIDGRVIYDPSKSSARRLDGHYWGVKYGEKAAVGGAVYWDVVSIGKIRVLKQAIQSVEMLTRSIELSMNASGVFGLAFDSRNKVQPTSKRTWFSKAKRHFQEPLFTTHLKDEAGNITYTPVVGNTGLWRWSSTGYRIGQGPFRRRRITGIADTGSSLMLMPERIAAEYWGQVDGANYDAATGGFTYPCGTPLPDFAFGVGKQAITVPGNMMHNMQNDGIWGGPALQAAFVVWDAGRMRLGWAQAA